MSRNTRRPASNAQAATARAQPTAPFFADRRRIPQLATAASTAQQRPQPQGQSKQTHRRQSPSQQSVQSSQHDVGRGHQLTHGQELNTGESQKSTQTHAHGHAQASVSEQVRVRQQEQHYPRTTTSDHGHQNQRTSASSKPSTNATILLENISLLAGGPHAFHQRYRVQLTADTFRKPGAYDAANAVLHFLLIVVDGPDATAMFAHCYPILDKSQERDFRKVVDTKLLALERKKLLPLGSTRRAVMQSAGGDRFEALVSALSTTALKQLSLRHPAHAVTHSLVVPVRNAFNSSPANYAKHLRTRIAAERIVFARTTQVGQGSTERWSHEVELLRSRVEAYQSHAKKLCAFLEKHAKPTSAEDSNSLSKSVHSNNPDHDRQPTKGGGDGAGDTCGDAAVDENASVLARMRSTDPEQEKHSSAQKGFLSDDVPTDIRSPAIVKRDQLHQLNRDVPRSQNDLGHSCGADLSASDDDCKDDALTQLLHFSAATAEDRAVMDKILTGFSLASGNALPKPTISASQHKEPVDIIQVIAHASHQLRLATSALKSNEVFPATRPQPGVVSNSIQATNSREQHLSSRREDVSDMSCDSILSLEGVNGNACEVVVSSKITSVNTPSFGGNITREPELCADEDVDVEINDTDEAEDDCLDPLQGVSLNGKSSSSRLASAAPRNNLEEAAKNSLLRHRAVIDSSSQLASLASDVASSVRRHTGDLLANIEKEYPKDVLNSTSNVDTRRSKDSDTAPVAKSTTSFPEWVHSAEQGIRNEMKPRSTGSDSLSSAVVQDTADSRSKSEQDIPEVSNRESVSSSALNDKIMFFNALDTMRDASLVQTGKRSAAGTKAPLAAPPLGSAYSATCVSGKISPSRTRITNAEQGASHSQKSKDTGITSSNRSDQRGDCSAEKGPLVSAISSVEREPKRTPKTVRFAQLPPPFISDKESDEDRSLNTGSDKDGITWTNASPRVPCTGSFSVTYGVDGVPIDRSALLTENVVEVFEDGDENNCASSTLVVDDDVFENDSVADKPEKSEKTVKHRIERRSTPRRLGRLLVPKITSESRSSSSRSPGDSGSLLCSIMPARNNDMSSTGDNTSEASLGISSESAEINSRSGLKLKPSGSMDMESVVSNSRSGLSYFTRTLRGTTTEPNLKRSNSVSSAGEIEATSCVSNPVTDLEKGRVTHPVTDDVEAAGGSAFPASIAKKSLDFSDQKSESSNATESKASLYVSGESSRATSDVFRRRLFSSPESKASSKVPEVVLEKSNTSSGSFRSPGIQHTSRSKSDILSNMRYVHFANGTDKSTRLLLSSGDGHDEESAFSSPLHNRRAESDILSESSPGLRSPGRREFFSGSIDGVDALRPLTRATRKSGAKVETGRPGWSPMNRIKALRDRLRRLA